MRLGTLTHIALAVVAVTGGLLHMVGWGFYLTDPWKRALWIGLTIFWVGLLLYMRIVKPLFMLRAPRSSRRSLLPRRNRSSRHANKAAHTRLVSAACSGQAP
jgi:predicted ferric reductase